MDNKWHFTEEGDYPVVFGEYLNKHYPQIPCLVEYRKTYGIRFWNVTEKCWDDEECDDFFCKKEAVARWRYLDALLVQQPALPIGLEEEIQDWCKENVTGVKPIYTGDSLICGLLPKTARHFAEWRAEHLKK